MTHYEKWLESIPRGKTINPQMAFEAGRESLKANLLSDEMVQAVAVALFSEHYKKDNNNFVEAKDFLDIAKAALKAVVGEL